MSFTSLRFFVFFAITLFLYYAAPRKARSAILLVASIAFYMSWGVRRVIFIVFAASVGFAAGIAMDRVRKTMETRWESCETGEEKKKRKAEEKKKTKQILMMGIAALLGILVIFKVIPFLPGEAFYSHWMTPLGISYYTLAIIGYMADVYWKKQKPETNPLKFLLFSSYFPGILQGPIERYHEIAHQLGKAHSFDFRKICFGLQLMLFGFFKKMVIADRIAMITGDVFANYERYSGSILLIGLCLRSLQLYCDFSACMDIAEGMSECFGITLAQNFNHPFFSRSAAEFWRRWHITLGTWFKDYVYMPVAISPRMMKCIKFTKVHLGKRASKAVSTIIPLMVVWILTGLWHGTGVNYVVWGLYWGSIIAISMVWEPEIKDATRRLKINVEAESWKVFQMIRTFALFTIGRWITVEHPIGTLRQMGNGMVWGNLFDGTLYTIGLDRPNMILLVISLLFLWQISLWQEKGCIREDIAQWNGIFRWAIYYIGIFSIVIFGIYGLDYNASEFIYMQY